jgi:hypothetical protein
MMPREFALVGDRCAFCRERFPEDGLAKLAAGQQMYALVCSVVLVLFYVTDGLL